MVDYDEFSLLHENAEEFGLPFDAPPTIRRAFVDLGDGRRLSAIVWGNEPVEAVLLHGGGQNAHTWDTVALALGRSLVAIDLPGHGHSDGLRAGATVLEGYAEDVALAVKALAPNAIAIVGMSAGGLTAISLSETAPDLVRKLVLVDILPDPDPAAARLIADFLGGPETFDNIDEILSRTMSYNPTRSISSLRRGILHNAVQLPDGRWRWRHQRHRRSSTPTSASEASDQSARLWALLGRSRAPLMLVAGAGPGSVVTAEHELRLRELKPCAQIERLPGAGHSIQGDQPIGLAKLLDQFLR